MGSEFTIHYSVRKTIERLSEINNESKFKAADTGFMKYKKKVMETHVMKDK